MTGLYPNGIGAEKSSSLSLSSEVGKSGSSSGPISGNMLSTSTSFPWFGLD